MIFTKNKIRRNVLFFIVASFLSIIIVFAQQGIGTSQIVITPTTLNVNSGSNISFNYTVELATGNTWGTTISVNNQSSLLSDGISVTFSNNGQDPNFSGIATVTTSSSTKPGSYDIELVATGDDPTTSPTILTLSVNGKTSTVNTTTAQQTNTTSKTNQTTTQQSNTKNASTTLNTVPYVNAQSNSSYKSQQSYTNITNQYPLYLSILAVIILFAVIIIRLKSL